MEKKILFVITGVILVASVACLFGCKRVKPEAPLETRLDSLIVPPLSTLVIPIHYEVAELEAILNSKTRGIFLDKSMQVNEKGDSLFLQVSKSRKIKLYWKSPTLIFELPLDISGKFKAKLAGVKIKNNVPVETSIVAVISTEIHLTNDWSLKTTSTLKKINWTKEPTLKIGFITVNLRKPVEKFLYANEQELATKLDSVIMQSLDSRSVMQKLWVDIQKPIRVNQQKSTVWLKGNAEGMSARWMDTGPKTITLEAELKTRIITLLEEDSIPESNPRLPRFTKKKNTTDSLDAYVLVRLPFTKINQLIGEELTNTKIEAAGYSTKIRSVHVYGIDNGLAVGLKLRGDVNGDVFLRGDLTLHADSSLLMVRNFHFDIGSENILATSAEWLLKSYATEMVASRLSWYYGEYLEQLPSLIEGGLEKGKMGNKLNLTISEFTVVPQTLLVTKKDIQLLIGVSGKADLSINNAIFAQNK